MKYIKSPSPKWLNSHLLWMDVKTVLKAVLALLTVAVMYYAAVYHLIGPETIY